jgi:hypothetical protein
MEQCPVNMDIPDPKVWAFKCLSSSTVAFTVLIIFQYLMETISLNQTAKVRSSECRNKQFCRPRRNSVPEILLQGYYLEGR